MNEREEMLSILSDLKEGSMTTNEAKKQLLILFGVEEKNEKFPTRKELDEGWEQLRNKGIDKPLDRPY